jgi:hypothetical protein
VRKMRLFGTGKFNRCIIKNAVCWDVTPCGSRKNRRFRGIYRLHIQVEKNLRARKNINSN